MADLEKDGLKVYGSDDLCAPRVLGPVSPILHQNDLPLREKRVIQDGSSDLGVEKTIALMFTGVATVAALAIQLNINEDDRNYAPQELTLLKGSALGDIHKRVNYHLGMERAKMGIENVVKSCSVGVKSAAFAVDGFFDANTDIKKKKRIIGPREKR